jgi:hypothetical protein
LYLQRAIVYLRKQGFEPEPTDLVHLSPLGWEHINLTGDCHWEVEQLMAQRVLSSMSLFYRKSRGQAGSGM